MKRLQLTTTVPTALLILALLYILYLTQCNPPRPCPPVAMIEANTKGSSKPKTDTVYRPGDTIRISKLVTIKGKDSIVFVPFQIVKTIPAIVDTQAVVNAFFAMRIQSDSFKTPDVTIQVTDTVEQNQITGRLWNVQVVSKTPVQKQSRQFYFGGGGYTSLFMNKGLTTEAISAGHIDIGYINRKGQHLKLDLMRSAGRWHQGISFYHTFGK